MTDDFLVADGEAVAGETLAVPKAKQLVRLLQSRSLPFARLVECRRAETAEVVVFEVDVELGQIQVHPISPIERLAARFDTEDRAMPEVLAHCPEAVYVILGATHPHNKIHCPCNYRYYTLHYIEMI